MSVKTPELPLALAKSPSALVPGLSALSGDRDIAAAVGMSVAAYAIWGVCVILFKWLGHVPLLEITAHRILWSLVFVALWLSLQNRWPEVKAAIAKPRNVVMLGVTGTLVGLNWLIFVWAVAAGQVLELSFGYFLAPICVVAVGTLLAGEQLVGRQRLVVGLTVAAVLIQALALGRLPVFALMVGLNWAIYTYVRRKVPVQAVPGFFIECLLLALPAVVYLAFLEGRGLGHFRTDTSTALLLISTVTVTAVPLILFAASNAKLRLVTTGLLQYITPSLHFLIALLVYGEPVNGQKLFTFLLIWAALAIFTYDAFERERAKTAAAKA